MWWSKDATTKDLLKMGSLERSDDSFYYEELDEQGRRNPSDDYLFDEDGFEICRDEPIYGISYDNIKEAFDDSTWGVSFRFIQILNEKISEIFLASRLKPNRTIANYNQFLSSFGNYLNKHSDEMGIIPMNISSIEDFYKIFKKELQKKKEEFEK
jgi:hypothetical protein